MIVRHYFKRTAMDPIGVGAYIVFPLVLVTLMVVTSNYLVEGYSHLINGRNLNHSFNIIVNMLIFQLMGSLIVIDYLFEDLRGDMRWRLLATPKPIVSFAFANMVASIAFSFISGGLLILSGAFVFNAYLHNVWVLIAVLVLMATLSQLAGVLFFMLCKKRATANTLGVVFCWGNALLSGLIFNIGFGEQLSRLGRLFTPFGWAWRAIMFSGGAAGMGGNIVEEGGMRDSLLNLGYLAGFCVALAVIILLLGRRKPV
ncbi:MAG: hypothetical protein FWE90_14285 [Defluviitaleaceae bacterium]|nr:hypothetical protein [Defluviitaleaceae bacterium]